MMATLFARGPGWLIAVTIATLFYHAWAVWGDIHAIISSAILAGAFAVLVTPPNRTTSREAEMLAGLKEGQVRLRKEIEALREDRDD